MRPNTRSRKRSWKKSTHTLIDAQTMANLFYLFFPQNY
jgi:hypothetical protein